MSKVKLALLCFAGLVGVCGYQVGKNAWETSAVDTENTTQLAEIIQIENGHPLDSDVAPDEHWLVAAAKRMIANFDTQFRGESESDQEASETGSLPAQTQVDAWKEIEALNSLHATPPKTDPKPVLPVTIINPYFTAD